jgi:hypothetical protein
MNSWYSLGGDSERLREHLSIMSQSCVRRRARVGRVMLCEVCVLGC